MWREDESPERRSAGWAVAGSLTIPGLGHWYLGDIRQAVAVAALYVFVVPMAVLLTVALDRELLLGVWIAVGWGWLLRVLAAIHAGIVAKRVRSFDAKFHTMHAYAAFVLVVVSAGQVASQVVRKDMLEILTVPSSSGRPNIDAGDHIIITKLTARDNEARRGDLVTFVVPGDMAIIVKRVVATEGETVSVVGGVVNVDGVAFVTSPCDVMEGLVLSAGGACVIERTPEGAAYAIQHHGLRDAAPVVVPAGHVFVLGDNRSESQDSRAFGPVSLGAVTGRVRGIWWPSERRFLLDPK
jgi:signal peptidase I